MPADPVTGPEGTPPETAHKANGSGAPRSEADAAGESGAKTAWLPPTKPSGGINPLRAFLAMPIDSTPRTLITAVGLCFICSIFVSAAAVVLKPLQLENKRLDRQQNILEVSGLMYPGADVEYVFDHRVTPRVVALETGRFTDAIDPASFDQRVAARDPARSIDLADDADPASIGRRANHAVVYLVENDEGRVERVILPVHGYGLWSTLYGFLAVAPDGDRILGLKFYEHAETPGLGGEVDNPKWRAMWHDKELFGDDGEIRVAVEKGDQSSDPYAVDALSGATLTSRGVHNLLRFWASEDGFGPFLENLPQELSDNG